MKRSLIAVGAALACLCQVSQATAQTARATTPSRPASYDYNYYSHTTQPSPSDLPSAQVTDMGEYDIQYGCSALESSCDAGCGCEPWRLMPQLPWCFTATGWINGGAAANADNPASRFNGPMTFPDREEVMLNQAYAVIERTADGSYGLDIGARLDLLFGTDYIFTQAVGLETDRQGNPKWNNRRLYGLAMPQAYVDFAYGDWSVKVGHFYSILGYETVTAPDNFFYSHAYTMQYGRPFTHTGVLSTYQVSDRLTVRNGIHSGWDIFDRSTERAAYTGGATWTGPEGLLTLSYGVTSGHELNNTNQYTNRTMYSLVASLQLTERTQYVIQHDHGWQEDFFVANVDAEWYGLNQYLFYTINDCWKWGTRVEWFRDDDGVRVTGVRPSNPIAGQSFVGNFYEISTGLNWLPTNNLVVRPEVRWDWYDGTGLPFDDGTKDNQFVGAVDMILHW